MKSQILFLVIIAILLTLYFYNVQGEGTYRNPIKEGRGQDPFVYYHTDGYYYWGITVVGEVGIDIMKSRRLTDFNTAERVRVFTTGPPYGALWAPELHFIQGNWYIYFALETNNDNINHRNYVIKALDPSNALGSYTPMVQLVALDSDVWGIDGTVLQYGDAQLYYIWSGWPTFDAGFPQNLYIAKMSDPMHLEGARVLLREPKSPWESIGGKLNEGPQVLKHNGRTFLIFSASGSWTPDYCLGMIGIDDLKDPMNASNWWQDVDGCVFWRNDQDNVYGVGHASFTTSPDGTESFIVYHGMEDPDAGWAGRSARAERFTWNPDGSPNFPRPSGFEIDLPIPSGQED